MKIKQSFAEMVSEFSGLLKTPDFKPIRSSPSSQSCRCQSPCGSGSSTPARKNSGDDQRRHSINIAVGVDSIPVISGSPPLEKPYKKYQGSRRQSAPCISPFASTTTLKEKLNRFKRTNSTGSDDELKEVEEEEFATPPQEGSNQRKMSYRIV